MGTRQPKKTTASHATRQKKNPGPPASPILAISDDELYERVASKAYELYQQRGEKPGNDLEDWLIAERLVREELRHGPVPEAPLMEE
jgi:hypothetical protein